jgi:putative transposase
MCVLSGVRLWNQNRRCVHGDFHHSEITLRKVSLPNRLPIKLLYLVLRRVSRDWKNAQREWTAAMTQFAIMSGDRFSLA